MELDRCPACNEPGVARGQFLVDGNYGLDRGGFALERACLFRFPPSVPLNAKPRACLSCGHVWSTIDPAKLRENIRLRGVEIDRQHLDEIDDGPFRDLPDTALARAMGKKVQEIDALVRNGRWIEAIRRYRDLQGVTWDQVHKDMNNWANMPREEKLALFGWVPQKKKGPVDELA